MCNIQVNYTYSFAFDIWPYCVIMYRIFGTINQNVGGEMVTVDKIAEFIDGKVIGDGSKLISGLSCAEFAGEGDVTFAITREDIDKADKSTASCVLIAEEVKTLNKTLIKVDDMKMALTLLYNIMLELKTPEAGNIHETAIVSETVKLGTNVSSGPWSFVGGNTVVGENAVIGANVVIGENCTIGSNVHIHPNVTIYQGITIGNNVTIHAGTVIGADGFGFIPKGDKIYKVPQLCGVIIEDDVEIGANVCIDRGAFTHTVIGKGTKMDNLIQIAHNCKIGKNVLIAGQAGIAGSTVVGDNTMMGGNVGISDHSNIGKNVKIAAKSAVRGKIEDGAVLWGFPAIDAKEFMQIQALLRLLRKKSLQLRELLRNK